MSKICRFPTFAPSAAAKQPAVLLGLGLGLVILAVLLFIVFDTIILRVPLKDWPDTLDLFVLFKHSTDKNSSPKTNLIPTKLIQIKNKKKNKKQRAHVECTLHTWFYFLLPAGTHETIMVVSYQRHYM